MALLHSCMRHPDELRQRIAKLRLASMIHRTISVQQSVENSTVQLRGHRANDILEYYIKISQEGIL